MKKTILLSIISIYSIIFKSLGITNNSLENPLKIIERTVPQKHFTVNKENLLEIFNSEPENVFVEMEIPYFNRIEKFQLEKYDLRGKDNAGFTFTSDGHYFSTKLYNGVAYRINDLNNINMGTMIIYPNNVNINFQINGQDIKVIKEYNKKNVFISKNEINDKNTEDFKNIRDIIAKIDKLKDKDKLTKQDLSAMKEIKEYDIKKQKESQQTIKQFKNDELLSPAPAPPPPPSCQSPQYDRCQVIKVNYMISYETYLKWQTPVFDLIDLAYPNNNIPFSGSYANKAKPRKRVIIKDTALKKSYNRKAVLQCKAKLEGYFFKVANIFKQEGINVQLGTIVVETNPLETQGKNFSEDISNLEEDTELEFDISTFKNQYLNGGREWQIPTAGDARDGNFKDIPRDMNWHYVGGNYLRTKPWSYGRLVTGAEKRGIYGLMELFRDRVFFIAHPTKKYKIGFSNGFISRIKYSSNSSFFNAAPDTSEWDRIGLKKYVGAPINDTVVYSLSNSFEGLWFYIGDVTPSTKNDNPVLSWRDFIRKDNSRAEIIRYSGQDNGNSAGEGNWGMKKGWGDNTIKLDPGTFKHNNYLPMMISPKDISDDYNLNQSITNRFFDLSKEADGKGLTDCGCHLQSIGVTIPNISYPTTIYGFPNTSKYVNDPDQTTSNGFGFIPLLGNTWYHTLDLESSNTGYFELKGDLLNGDAYEYKNRADIISFSEDSSSNNIIWQSNQPDTLLLWNYHDVEELFGTTGQFGNSNHLSYNIDKWNVWMLVHNIAMTLGPRYFTTKTNPNTILAPLARNYNYNADSYESTPHISERIKMSDNTEMNYSWFGYFYRNYTLGSIGKSIAAPSGLGGILAIAIVGAVNFFLTSGGPFWSNALFAVGTALSVGNAMILLGSVLATVVIIQLLSDITLTGFKIENNFSPKERYVKPYIYSRHIQSTNESGDNYDSDGWGEKGSLYIGWQNWFMDYSMYDLDLKEAMCPVDLVSFSKGFDKKTGDLIRLNLTNEFVNGHGPHVNDCNYLIYGGFNNPYADISLWNKDTSILNSTLYSETMNFAETEYKFAGDTIIARNGVGAINNILKENIVIRKNNSLETEQQVNDWDNTTTLDDYYGKQMKPQAQNDSAALTLNNSFDWKFNGSTTNITYPKGNRRIKSAIRIAIPNTANNDSSFRIYPLTLQLTDTNGCTSNLAKKYIRVYPKKQFPLRSSFISKPNSTLYTPFGYKMTDFFIKPGESRIKFDLNDLNTKNLYGTRYTGLKNWEFIGPWSTGEGPDEASTYPSTTGANVGFYSRSMKPWSPSRLSNTGWGIANKSDLRGFSNGSLFTNHPIFASTKFLNISYLNFWSNYVTLSYFPIRNKINSSIAQRKNVNNINIEDNYNNLYDKSDNYMSRNLGFKNEKLVGYRSTKIKEKLTYPNGNTDEEDFDPEFGLSQLNKFWFLSNSSFLTPDAKSPIKYFYGFRRTFPTSHIVDYGVRKIFNEDKDYSTYFGNGSKNPSRLFRPASWFHERDYIWINRIRANVVYGNKFGEGREWYRLRYKIQQPPLIITDVGNKDFITYNYGATNTTFTETYANYTTYTPEERASEYISNSITNNLEDIKEHCSLTYYRKNTSDVALSPLYFNNDRNNNFLKFRLSYSSFSPDTAVILGYRWQNGTYQWPQNQALPNSPTSPLLNTYFANYGQSNDSLEIWLIASEDRYDTANFIFPSKTKVKIFSRAIKEMSSYRNKNHLFRFVRTGDPFQYSINPSSQTPSVSNNFVKTNRPGYALEPIVPLTNHIGPGIPTPIGTVAWFPEVPEVESSSSNIPLLKNYELWHAPLAEYLKSPVNNNYYKNTIDWNDININLDGYDKYRNFQFEIIYKNRGNYNKYSSSFILGSMEIESGLNLPLPLCQGGEPTIEFTTAINDTLPLNNTTIDPEQTVPWRLSSPIPNNIDRFEVYSLNFNTNPPTRSINPIASGTTGQKYFQAQNQILKCPDALPTINCPTGTFIGPLLISGDVGTRPGILYGLEAHLINERTTTINNVVLNETTPTRRVISVSAYQQKLPKRKPMFIPDSIFNLDGSFSITATFNRFNIKGNIENFTLQKAIINSTGDTTWQNASQTLTYRNCTPAMPLDVKFFNYQTECTFRFNINSLPNSTTPLPNGVHVYRLRLSSQLDNPVVEFTNPVTFTICRTCKNVAGGISIYVKSSNDSEPGFSSENFGNYTLYAQLFESAQGEPHNITYIDLFEENYTNNTTKFLKRININTQYAIYLIIDSIFNKPKGLYGYYLKGYTDSNTPPIISSSVRVRVKELPCYPNQVIVESDSLYFDINSVCALTKYKVQLYKLENKTIITTDSNGNEAPTVINASNQNLSEQEINLLNVSSTPIGRFQNDEVPDGTLRFTSQEITNNFFYRKILKPNVLNSWYRIDVICTSCSENNISSFYYYFNN